MSRAAWFAAAVLCCAASVGAQTSPIDLAGSWGARVDEDLLERNIGPDAVDYLGLPLSEEGRAKALSHSDTVLSMVERQCLYYPPHYLVLGAQGFRMWSESDPVTGQIVAWRIGGASTRAPITIWMDGRARPSEDARHPIEGFTTGAWDGDVLRTFTTHVKAGYLRRNGTPSSDALTMTMFFARHDDVLTITAFIEDPINLTVPYVLSRDFQLQDLSIPPTPEPCVPGVELDRPLGDVVHYLPGKNPFVDEMTTMYGIPREAVMGGEVTLYPEYREKVRPVYVAPQRCVRYCCTLAGCTTGGNPQFPDRAF